VQPPPAQNIKEDTTYSVRPPPKEESKTEKTETKNIIDLTHVSEMRRKKDKKISFFQFLFLIIGGIIIYFALFEDKQLSLPEGATALISPRDFSQKRGKRSFPSSFSKSYSIFPSGYV